MLSPNHSIHSNVECEQQVLGTLLLRNDLFDRVSHILQPHHFSDEIHQKIYSAICDRMMRGEKADIVLIKNALSKQIDLESYLVELTTNVISVVSILDQSRLLVDLYKWRELSRMFLDLQNARSDDMTLTDVCQDAENRLNTLMMIDDCVTMQSVDNYWHQALQSIEDVRAGKIEAVSTGFTDLDKKVIGFTPGRLYVLAARPGMGKTAMALNMAEAAARKGTTLFFSLEMGGSELAMRLAARHTGVDVSKQQNAKHLVSADYNAVKSLKTLSRNLIVDEAPALAVGQIRLRARRIKREHKGLSLLVIDYLGFIKPTDPKQPRVYQVQEITAALKALAKELNVPILLLSQLNRGVEKQQDKRPSLADLRDSGSIEQDADVVMFIYRDEYYLQQRAGKQSSYVDEEDTKMQRKLEQSKGKAELIVAKNRHGTAGIINLGFNAEKQLFYDGGE